MIAAFALGSLMTVALLTAPWDGRTPTAGTSSSPATLAGEPASARCESSHCTDSVVSLEVDLPPLSPQPPLWTAQDDPELTEQSATGHLAALDAGGESVVAE